MGMQGSPRLFQSSLLWSFLAGLITFFLDGIVLDAATAAAALVIFRRPPPDADHVVGGDGHDVRVVVGRGHFVDDDVVTVDGHLPGVLQVVVLQLGPHEPGEGGVNIRNTDAAFVLQMALTARVTMS